MDLGFDTNIRSICAANVSSEFTIQGTVYRTLRLLYDLGADTVTGKGTRVFEVIDQRTKKVRVIKDCWVEDRAGNQMEHEVVVGIKQDVNNDENFHKHFINICGYQKTDTSGGFDRLCKVLKTETFGGVGFRSWHTTPITDFQKPVYHPSAEDMTPNQGGYLLQTPAEHTSAIPPRSRSRYQVVYDEKGYRSSKYRCLQMCSNTLFKQQTVCHRLCQIHKLAHVAPALHCLHQTEWIHRDFTPGNVIVVGMTARISDFEFAARRAAGELEELTRPKDTSPAMRDIRMVGLSFANLTN